MTKGDLKMHNEKFIQEYILGVCINGDYDLVNRVVDLIVTGAKVKQDPNVLEHLHFMGLTY
jgi:hypothetical protein